MEAKFLAAFERVIVERLEGVLGAAFFYGILESDFDNRLIPYGHFRIRLQGRDEQGDDAEEYEEEDNGPDHETKDRCQEILEEISHAIGLIDKVSRFGGSFCRIDESQ